MTKWWLLAAMLTGLTSTTLVADEADEADVDYLELASLMLKDNNLERAETALSQVNREREGFDLQRFHVVSGLLQVRKGENQAAIDAFQAAKKLGEVDLE